MEHSKLAPSPPPKMSRGRVRLATFIELRLPSLTLRDCLATHCPLMY